MRNIVKGTVVGFTANVNGTVKYITGEVMSFIPLREARERGLVAKPRPDARRPRKSGTVLEINAQIEPGHHKLLYRHRSLVRLVKPVQVEEEVEQVG